MLNKSVYILVLIFICGTLFAQEQAPGRAQNQDETPAFDKVAPEIPGVVKAGTKIEIVKYGLRGSDGGVGMPDGSVLVSTNNSVIKVDVDGNATTLVEDSGKAAGLALDPKGRVIAAQYTGKVSVLYPKGSEELLTDKFDGKPYIRPNDLVLDKKGRHLFHGLLPDRRQAVRGGLAAGGLLHHAGRKKSDTRRGRYWSAQRDHPQPE